MKNLIQKIDNYFEVTKRGSTFSREIIAGVIVFFAMCYILPVNASILGGQNGEYYAAVFMATAICSAICTILMGAFAKYPIALSAGMGLNAFLAFTVCGALNYSWGESMAIVIFSGVVFFIFSMSPLRSKIINAIPLSLKYAISAGLGAFICFVGLSQAGIIVSGGGTLVELGDLTDPLVLLACLGVAVAFTLLYVKSKINRFAILIAMAVTALVGAILGYVFGFANMPQWSNQMSDISELKKTMFVGFKHFEIFTRPETYAIVFALVFVNLFDTTATLLGVSQAANLLDEKGEMRDVKKLVFADATGSLIAGVLGTAPVTSFAESTVGIQSGARTGITAITTGLLFTISIFAYPLFSFFSCIEVQGQTYTPVTSLALVCVGAMMFSHLKNIDWSDKIIVSTTFLIVILMLLTYSISEGLGIGLIFYCLMMIASKRYKEVNIVVYIMAAFFLLNFALSAVVY